MKSLVCPFSVTASAGNKQLLHDSVYLGFWLATRRGTHTNPTERTLATLGTQTGRRQAGSSETVLIEIVLEKSILRGRDRPGAAGDMKVTV